MKIKVLMLWYKKLYSQTRPKSITFIAVDEEGSLFEIVITDKISEKWASRIKEGDIYILKGILSSENDKKLNMIETKFQMNITNDTKRFKLNKEQMETVVIPPVTSLADLHLVRQQENYLKNFVVYVIDVRPLSLRNQKKGRFTLSASNFTRFFTGPNANTTATKLHEWVTTNLPLKVLSEEDMLHTNRLIPLTHPEQLMTIRQVKENTPNQLMENQARV